jgi:hypothetical protein
MLGLRKTARETAGKVTEAAQSAARSVTVATGIAVAALLLALAGVLLACFRRPVIRAA